MKIRWKKVFYFVFLLGSMLGFKDALGQIDSIQNKNIESNLSENSFQISGVVKSSNDSTPIPFCNIALFDSSDRQISITQTDFDGKFTFIGINKNSYTIKAECVGYESIIAKNINMDSTVTINFLLNYRIAIMCYEVMGSAPIYHLPSLNFSKVPLYDPKKTTSGETIGGEDIKNMPFRR